VFRARFYAESKPKFALESAQKALANGVNPDVLSAHIAAAISHSVEPKYQGRVLANFARIYPDRWLWHKAAMAYMAEKKDLEAKEAFQMAIAHGNDLESRVQLALLEATRLKNHSEAIATYEKVLSILPADAEVDPSVVAGIRARISMTHLDAGKITESILHASLMIAEYPMETTLIQALYEVFQTRKLEQKLVPALSLAAARNPFFTYAHVALGDASSLRGEFVAAVRHYGKAVALLPEEDFPYAKRAHAYYSQQNYAEALSDFNRALALRPDISSHHYNRSCMLALLGKNDEAMVSLRAAIALEPRLAVLAGTDSDLAGLRISPEFRPQMASLGVITGVQKTTASADIKKSEAP
jgi:tetratricopeptide (TPR) repeat protein